MKQTVYLSQKKVFLNLKASDVTSQNDVYDVVNEISKILSGSNNEIVDSEKRQDLPSVSARLVELKLIKFIHLKNNLYGLVLSVKRPELIGTFFYREGDNFISEMINPDTDNVSEVIIGEA